MEQSAAQLEVLTVSEKVQLPEQGWQRNGSQPASLASPTWHPDVLAERRQRLLDGSAQRLSWHEAKAQLQRLSE